jgi:hypothetical protein
VTVVTPQSIAFIFSNRQIFFLDHPPQGSNSVHTLLMGDTFLIDLKLSDLCNAYAAFAIVSLAFIYLFIQLFKCAYQALCWNRFMDLLSNKLKTKVSASLI